MSETLFHTRPIGASVAGHRLWPITCLVTNGIKNVGPKHIYLGSTGQQVRPKNVLALKRKRHFVKRIFTAQTSVTA